MQPRRGLPPNVMPMLSEDPRYPTNPSGMRQAIMQNAAPQSVAEILSQGSPGQPMPDLSGATSAASRQRQIADMLLQGAQQQDNTSIAGGLSQLGQAFLARRAGQKADTAEDKQREMASLLMQQALAGDRNAQAQIMPIADLLARDERIARQKIEDERYATEYSDKRADRAQDVGYRDEVFNTQTGQWERGFGLQQNQFDLQQNEYDLRGELGRGQLGLGWAELEARKAEARAKLDAESAPKAPEFGDTWKMRSDFEKQARGFEEAQRQYMTMGDLAKDATGASDVALGFAFFKTIDPSSTVREGEFAAAAGAMGLGAQFVQQFARLDRGEKFSPQLRQELLQAAGHAYTQQAQDIEALYEREGQFASSMGVNPSLIVRNPVRPRQGEGTMFKGGDFQRSIPQSAMQELFSDPSPEAFADFEKAFGPGSGEWARVQMLRERGGMR